MSTDKVLRVSQESIDFIHEYATAKGITVRAAGDALIGTARSRLAALTRYGAAARKLRADKPAAKRTTKKPA